MQWINIERVDDEALGFLKKNYLFHHLDLEDIQSESQTPKIDSYKNYVFLVLQFPHWDGLNKTVVPYEVDIFVGENYLITIQHGKIKEMKNFFYKCMKNKKVKKEWMRDDAGTLIYHLLSALFHNTHPILNNIGKQISAVEEKIFTGEPGTQTIRQLALLRRNVLSFRRILDPERYLMATLSHTRKPFLKEEMSLYFDNIVDYLNKLWAILDTYRDTIDGLHVTVESLINRRTNKVIGALTVISVSLLPLTLLTGVYGMNIPIPYADRPIVVGSMFLFLIVVILLVIVHMKKRKWL